MKNDYFNKKSLNDLSRNAGGDKVAISEYIAKKRQYVYSAQKKKRNFTI